MKKLPEGHPDRYDWSRATRGTVAKKLAAERTNLRALDEDVAAAFPDSTSVNEALRAVLATRGGAPRPPRSLTRPMPSLPRTRSAMAMCALAPNAPAQRYAGDVSREGIPG